MELIDDLRVREGDRDTQKPLEFSEWQIYKLIIDRLMMRDFQPSALSPDKRRHFLQHLAVVLSGRDTGTATSEIFHDLIDSEFKQDFRLMDQDEKTKKREELFEDLRTSATLTRTEVGRTSGWRFSHNSLREYLVAEYMVAGLYDQRLPAIPIPISPAMMNFVATIPVDALGQYIQRLSDLWHLRSSQRDIGTYLQLLWTALSSFKNRPINFPLFNVPNNSAVSLDNIRVANISFDDVYQLNDNILLDCQYAEFSEVSFNGLNLHGSNFSQATLDTCSFQNTKLSGVIFNGALLFECDVTDAALSDADFRGMDNESSIIIRKKDEQPLLLAGARARGYLAFSGAKTDSVTSYEYWQYHPKFSIAVKICRNIISQKKSQLRGLTQRGEAHQDPPFARDFVQYIMQKGLVKIDQNNLVYATTEGKEILPAFVEHEVMHSTIAAFFSERC